MRTRPDTLDEYVVREQTVYLPLGIRVGDSVLDLGGHIGAFASRAAGLGAGAILSFEPDPENFGLLVENTAGLPVDARQAAVVPDGRATVTLYRNVRKNTGSHSLHIKRGRQPIEVPAVAWPAVLARGPFDVAKCDIEGAEYDLPLWELEVRALAVELHLNRREWRAQAPAFVARIEAAGFVPVRPPRIGEKNWHTLGIWHRD